MLTQQIPLEFHDACNATSQCTTAEAYATFMFAINAVAGRKPDSHELVLETISSSSCHIRAVSWVWTAYYCALSLHGPKDLHPMALRLAARFIKGSRVEKHLIAQTILAWRTSNLVAGHDLDALSTWLTALPLCMPPSILTVCSFLAADMPHQGHAPNAKAPWDLRKSQALYWLLTPTPMIHAAPPRTLVMRQPFSLQNPLNDNAKDIMVARAFQTMEGCEDADNPFVFNIQETQFYMHATTSACWFIVGT